MNIRISHDTYSGNSRQVDYRLKSIDSIFAEKDFSSRRYDSRSEDYHQDRFLSAGDLHKVKPYMSAFLSSMFSIKDILKDKNHESYAAMSPHSRHFIQNLYASNISSQIASEKLLEDIASEKKNSHASRISSSITDTDLYTPIEFIENIPRNDKGAGYGSDISDSFKKIHRFTKKDHEMLLIDIFNSNYKELYTTDTTRPKVSTYVMHLSDIRNATGNELSRISSGYADLLKSTTVNLNNRVYSFGEKNDIIRKYNEAVTADNKKKIGNAADRKREDSYSIGIYNLKDAKHQNDRIKSEITIGHDGKRLSNQTSYQSAKRDAIPQIGFKDIIGLKEPKAEIQNFIYSKRYPDIFRRYHAKGDFGILLHGKPGNGKTRFAQAVANELNIPFMNIKLSSILSKYYGESENILQSYFDEGKKHDNIVMLFDKIDAISPSRNDRTNDQKHKGLLNILLTNLDGFEKQESVLPIATTNAIEQIDPALKRNGRFSKIIEISSPGLDDIKAMYRYKTVHQFEGLKDTMERFSPEEYEDISRRSIGFSYANIDAVIERTKCDSAIKHIETKKEYKTRISDIIKNIESIKDEIILQNQG